MLPQFFDIFGVAPRGLTFERIFWACVSLLGLLLVYREWVNRRPLSDAWYGWVLSIAMIGLGGYNFAMALISRRLFFGQGGLKLPNYGVAIALGFIAGIAVAVRESRRSPEPPNAGHILDLAFWILIASMVGSRLLYALVNWREYHALCFSPESFGEAAGQSDCLAVFKIWKGGLVFYGGVIGAALAGWVYCRRHRIGFMRTADVFTPSLALGHAIGRLGCFAAGCCYGRVSSGPMGIHMPQGSPVFRSQHEALMVVDPQAAMDLIRQGHSLPVHPTQLYEVAAELVLFVGLILLRSRKRFDGQLLACWLIAYSILRAVIELFRGDRLRGFLFEWAIPSVNRALGIPVDEPVLLSTSQAVSLVTGICGVALYWILRAHKTTRA